MSSNSKRKRNVLNIETKLEILKCLVKGESVASLAQFYNVGKSTVSDIKKSRETILNFALKLDSEDGWKKRKTMREANDVVLDRALYLWFSQRRSKEDPTSGPLLCEKALELNEKLGGSADFKDQNEGVL
ncbi:jerky protein homolog-like [Trichonephila clavipes]|nr:jerky protein homolog-like [Trichonephila clavipes]